MLRPSCRVGDLAHRRCPDRGGLLAFAVVLSSAASLKASPNELGDYYYLAIHSETRAELFRRAALPGPNGAIVTTDTVLPVRESVLLRAQDLDTPMGTDSADFEASGWALVAFPEGVPVQSPDGDVQTAFVRLHRGPASFRIGRQLFTGGAARYVRFDGLAADVQLGSGFEASAYGGLTALPRWGARPAYYNLGATSDVALRNPEALPPAGRSGYSTGGIRVGWADEKFGAQLSFHEQRDSGELGHRSLGADVQVRRFEHVAFFGDAILEMDAGRLSDARLWVDASPVRPLDLSVELRHTEPALLLSRTSVLSVFSTSAFDETGADVILRATESLTFDANGFVQIYDDSRPGARSELSAKFVADRNRRSLVRLWYARLLAPDNGYHSVRASFSQRFLPTLTGTLEAYQYLYDRAVLQYRTSSVFSGTLALRPSRVFGVLWAASLAQSPYARLDAQTLVQLTCDFDSLRSPEGAMNAGARLLPLALVLACVLAVVMACGSAPEQRFPHVLHLAKIGCGVSGKEDCLSCTTCHAVSEKERAHHLPEVTTCERCHRKDAHELASAFTWEPKRPNGRITFDHSRHLAMSEIRGQCVGCHEGVVVKDTPRLPPMKQCFSCHEHQEEWKQGRCAPCHDPGELAHVMPQTFLRHDGSFARHHGRLATSDKVLCQSCHAQADCDVCHDTTQDLAVERRRPEAIERTFVHRGDFLSRHAMEAQSSPAKCISCHTPQTCDACHVERGVSGNALGARNPHPPGWVTNDPSASSGHGREARRDILLCAGCHDQGPATNCIRCHKVGGYGGNPHPGGWRSTQSEQSEMCRYCHG